MLDGIKKALWYAIILGLFLTAYQMYFQPLWNSWIEGQGLTVGFLETSGGYVIAIMLGLLARWFAWSKFGK